MVVVEQLEAVLTAARSELSAVVGCALGYRRPFPGPSTTARPEWLTAPVVLVHGAGHNPSAWCRLGNRLEASGFADLHGVAYGIGADVASIADVIAAGVDDALRGARATRVHVVAHSLGGVATRYWHDVLGGRERVDAVVTLGTPHAGIPWARLPALPQHVRDLAPGTALFGDYSGDLSGDRCDYSHWTTVGASMDALVPAARAPTSRRRVASTSARSGTSDC